MMKRKKIVMINVNNILMIRIGIVKTNVKDVLNTQWVNVENGVMEDYVRIMDVLHALEYQKICLCIK